MSLEGFSSSNFPVPAREGCTDLSIRVAAHRRSSRPPSRVAFGGARVL